MKLGTHLRENTGCPPCVTHKSYKKHVHWERYDALQFIFRQSEYFLNMHICFSVPPTISDGLDKYIKEPGTYLRIPCEVSGIPTPEVTWTQNGNSVRV